MSAPASTPTMTSTQGQGTSRNCVLKKSTELMVPCPPLQAVVRVNKNSTMEQLPWATHKVGRISPTFYR